MNLYLLSQIDMRGYDTFDACVVAAPDEVSARSFHPGTGQFEPYDPEEGEWADRDLRYNGTWARRPAHVQVTLIGVATESVALGCVLSSFHAG